MFSKYSSLKSVAPKYALLLLLCLLPLSCSSSSSTSASNISVGAKLYDQNSQLWGTVVDTSDSHTFENGAVEPGVKVDYGPRMGNPPVSPVWLPTRSAERFRVE